MNRKSIYLIVSFLLLLVVVWILFESSTSENEVRYTITDLGAVEDGFISPVSINNRGHVAGRLGTLTGSDHAFLWTPEEGMKDIGPFFPQRMNESDEVVGFLQKKNNKVYACLWTPSEGLIDLGTLGGGISRAHGINNRSEVVGTSTGNNARSGFIWTATDGMRLLSTEWQALDINDEGEILCSGRSDTTTEPYFVYSRTQGEIIPSEDRTSSLELPLTVIRYKKLSQGGEILYCLPFDDIESKFPIPMEEGYAVSVNRTNGVETVGNVIYLNPFLKRSLYKKGLPKFFFNALAWIVKHLQDSRAVLWEGEESIDLTNSIPSESGWDSLLGASGINESGQITGTGLIDGEYHAFLLTPINESTDDGD